MEQAVPEARPEMQWATWNARALSHSNAEVRAAKVEFVRKLAAKSAILMLQETHARGYDLLQVLRSVSESHWILSSGESDSTGGVAVLVSRGLSREMPQVVDTSAGEWWK